MEAIAKRLAKQEIKDQNHFENEDDSDVFGESTSSDARSRRDGYSDTESDPTSTKRGQKREGETRCALETARKKIAKSGEEGGQGEREVKVSEAVQSE